MVPEHQEPEQDRGGGGGGGGNGGKSRSDGRSDTDDQKYEQRKSVVEAALHTEINSEKQGYLLELMKFKKQGIELTRSYTMEDTLDDIQFEFDRIKTHLQTVNNVGMISDGLMFVFQGLEFANNQFGPILQLDGWSAAAKKDKQKYNHVIERLYKKHWRHGNTSPEVEFGWLIGSSMLKHHFKCKLQKSFKLPVSDDSDSDDSSGNGNGHGQRQRQQQRAPKTKGGFDLGSMMSNMLPNVLPQMANFLPSLKPPSNGPRPAASGMTASGMTASGMTASGIGMTAPAPVPGPGSGNSRPVMRGPQSSMSFQPLPSPSPSFSSPSPPPPPVFFHNNRPPPGHGNYAPEQSQQTQLPQQPQQPQQPQHNHHYYQQQQQQEQQRRQQQQQDQERQQQQVLDLQRQLDDYKREVEMLKTAKSVMAPETVSVMSPVMPPATPAVMSMSMNDKYVQLDSVKRGGKKTFSMPEPDSYEDADDKREDSNEEIEYGSDADRHAGDGDRNAGDGDRHASDDADRRHDRKQVSIAGRVNSRLLKTSTATSRRLPTKEPLTL